MQSVCKREDVIQSLEAVLQDAKFAAAPQMSAFLKFVVMQTLDGKSDRIKAYTVAVDALGKPSTFDPQNDPSVRVLAKRLRDTLTAYYERTNDHKVFLRLTSGSYIPTFELGGSAAQQQHANVSNLTTLSRTSEVRSNDLRTNDTIANEPSRNRIGNGSMFGPSKLAKR